MLKWSTECDEFFHFLIIFKYWIITFSPRRDLDNVTNVIWCLRLCGKDDHFFVNLFNVSYFTEDGSIFLDIFLKIFLSLCDVMTWTLLHMPVNCWLGLSSMTCCNAVGFFLTMLTIETLGIFPAVNSRSHGLVFVDWDT